MQDKWMDGSIFNVVSVYAGGWDIKGGVWLHGGNGWDGWDLYGVVWCGRVCWMEVFGGRGGEREGDEENGNGIE